MRYLHNCWYMAAWASELQPGAMLARRLLDQPVVLVRDHDGQLFALHDRCPHRFAPLSRGLVRAAKSSAVITGWVLTGRGSARATRTVPS